VSKERQRQQLIKRLEDPEKNWKFSLTDLSERERWKDYMEAYQEVLEKTNTEWAPWYVIPADKKWVTRASVSEILVSKIAKLDLKYPVLTEEQTVELKKAKDRLCHE
jgi:polyphosphate kinase 2 (PPK2 family)